MILPYIFINLDIYFKIHQNNTIENEMDAWLMFLGTDDPNRILQLLDQYPWFEDLYRDLYTACRNTVQYMIDEMEEQIKEQKHQLKEKDIQLESQQAQLKNQQTQLKNQQNQLKLLEQLCRSLIADCQARGDSRDTAIQFLCEHTGLEAAAAAEIVDRYWNA